MKNIYLIDVTNRDGVQTSRIMLSKLAKTMMNIYLDDMGIFQSEFGFPTTHHEANYLKTNLELAKMGVISPMRLEGWLRAVVGDVELALETLPDLEHINVSISTSKSKRNSLLKVVVQVVINTALSHIPDRLIRSSSEATFRIL